jgi:hypothetical protein
MFNGNPGRDAMPVRLLACARRDLSISGMKRFLLSLAIESLSRLPWPRSAFPAAQDSSTLGGNA